MSKAKLVVDFVTPWPDVLAARCVYIADELRGKGVIGQFPRLTRFCVKSELVPGIGEETLWVRGTDKGEDKIVVTMSGCDPTRYVSNLRLCIESLREQPERVIRPCPPGWTVHDGGRLVVATGQIASNFVMAILYADGQNEQERHGGAWLTATAHTLGIFIGSMPGIFADSITIPELTVYDQKLAIYYRKDRSYEALTTEVGRTMAALKAESAPTIPADLPPLPPGAVRVWG